MKASSVLMAVSLMAGLVAQARRILEEQNATGSPVVHSECLASTSYSPYIPLHKVQPQDLQEYAVSSRCVKPKLTSLGDALFVTTTFNTETAWMKNLISIPYIVYHAGDRTKSHSHPNYAHEAMGYLWFLAEYYDCLPNVTLFAPPNKIGHWQVSGNLDYNIDRVKLDAIPGYAVLHRTGLWWENWVNDTSMNLAGQEVLVADDRANGRAVGDCDQLINGTAYRGVSAYRFWRGEWISKAWDSFFGPVGMGPLVERTRCPIASEFFVTKERVQRHPRDFYLKLIHWAINSEKLADLNSYQVGCVLEGLWHYIFGEPAYMEDLTISECNLYDCTF